MSKQHVWERVQRDNDRETLRMKVKTGWIYLITEFGEVSGSVLKQTSVFVPDAQGE